MEKIISAALLLMVSLSITGCKDKISPGTKEVKEKRFPD